MDQKRLTSNYPLVRCSMFDFSKNYVGPTLSTENADRTMTVLRHALCGDDFHQTPVSIMFREKFVRSSFFSGFVGDATQDLLDISGLSELPLDKYAFFYVLCARFPSRTCLRRGGGERTNKKTYRYLLYHSSGHPQDYRSQGPITKATTPEYIGSCSNTARTNDRTRVVLLPALLADGRRV